MAAMKFHSNLTRRDILAQLMAVEGLSSFVEVGCKEGRLTGHILKTIPRSRVWAIDPWAPIPNSAETYEDWDYGKIEAEFWNNVEGHAGRLEMRRTTSLECAAYFSELKEARQLPKEVRHGFDLVFLDAAHDEENVEKDIDAWFPLVRSDGFLAGHDYQHKFPGVMRAVAKKFPLMLVAVAADSVWMVKKAPGVTL
jgi:hypothetical protein